MSTKFKMGSIAEIVNSATTSPLKKAKQKVEKKQDKIVTAEVNEVPFKQMDKTVSVGKKRKILSIENEPKQTKIESIEHKNPNKKRKNKSPINADTPKPDGSKESKSTVNATKPAKKKKQNKKDKNILTNKADTIKQELKEENSAEETQVEDEASKREKLSRTLFIGNLPSNFSLKNLKKTLAQYGSVASIRVRGVAPAKQTLSKKAAFLSKQINPNKKTVNAYVVFRVTDSVQKAIDLNGANFEGNVIQVDKVEDNPVYQNTLSVFLGNLSFKATDNDLREFFKDCGEISNVRLIRDSKTGIGKGFGYITFKQKDGVVLALEKNEQAFLGREIRVKPYHYNQTAKQNNKKDKSKNKFQKQTKSPVRANNKQVKSNPAKEKTDSSTVMKSDFKGETSSKKKQTKKIMKNRIKSNKLNKQKKKIAEILSK